MKFRVNHPRKILVVMYFIFRYDEDIKIDTDGVLAEMYYPTFFECIGGTFA